MHVLPSERFCRVFSNRNELKALVDARRPPGVDKPGRSNAENMWFGAKSMYDRAGFKEVARHKPQPPIVRLHPA